MAYAIIALVVLGVIWALIVSRGFRITVGLLVLVGVVWFVAARDQAEKQRAVDQIAARVEETKDKARQDQLWSKVPPSQVELRGPSLEPERFGSDDDYELSASIKNLSNEQLGAFEIEVTASDCIAREKCEVIGRASEVVWTDIPPQQVRGISGKVRLVDMPELRGELSTRFTVKRVYAGDLLDQWSISTNDTMLATITCAAASTVPDRAEAPPAVSNHFPLERTGPFIEAKQT